MSRGKVRLDTYSNAWYKPAGLFKRALWYWFNAVFFKRSWNPGSAHKRALLRLFGAHIGKGVVIKPCVNIKYPWLLSVGDYTWIGENVWIDNLGKVTIGNNCCLSQGAFLLCGNHDYNKPSFDLMVRDIVLEDGVWIGARATVCPGITAKTHSVLSVGSVATQEMEAYFIYTGNPAQKVKERNIE
ncbi:MAG: WcaF family extracellular polysaccharide biosynthesis acetyltransferase [Flavobacteriales bacterium]